ncbi:MAG: hypothetical protein KTQ49_05705 [Candidatus Omnitrophica bacterium]|nr:hypothetical protein [Candidatus Omnitrophota bacterium]
MRRITLAAALGAVLFLAALFDLAAATEEVRVTAEVDKAFLTVGDRLTYTVLVEHGPDIQVLSSIPAPASDILEIKKIEDIKKQDKKKIVEGRRFILTTYRLGEFILDPVVIEYRKTGEPVKKVQTNKLYLTVQSVTGGKPQEDIRDVKPVVPLTFRLGAGFWILVGVALLALAYGGYRRFLRGKKISLPAPPPLSPDEEALMRLNELFESDLIRRGLYKPYYLRLSEILRVYFEKRFGVLAVELTTAEILKALRPLRIEPGLFQKVQYVLEASDLAKFAKWAPTPSEVVQINKKSEEIVRESVPPAPPPGEAPRGV